MAALTMASKRLSQAAAEADPFVKAEILRRKAHIDEEAEDLKALVKDPKQTSGMSSIEPDDVKALLANVKWMRKELDPAAGNDFDEDCAKDEIAEMRRVRRQIRYLFGGFVAPQTFEGARHVEHVPEVVSAKTSSRAWAEDVLKRVAKKP